jgi:hypothetical protein
MKMNTVILANSTIDFPSNLSSSNRVWDIKLGEKYTLMDKAVESYSIGTKNIIITNNASNRKIDGIEFIHVSGKTAGALSTLALSVDSLTWDLPVLVAPIDGIIPKESVNDFVQGAIGGGYLASIVSFFSTDPKYSYVRTSNNQVTEIAEKSVISNQATAGVFFFKDVETMLSCVEWSIINNVKTEDKYYIAPSLNKLITRNERISLFKIDIEKYYRFSSPAEASKSIVRINLHEDI